MALSIHGTARLLHIHASMRACDYHGMAHMTWHQHSTCMQRKDTPNLQNSCRETRKRPCTFRASRSGGLSSDSGVVYNSCRSGQSLVSSPSTCNRLHASHKQVMPFVRKDIALMSFPPCGAMHCHATASRCEGWRHSHSSSVAQM